MSNSPNGWIRASIQSRLESEFPGEWGVEPVFRSDNARVLRATDLDADGHIDYESAARRRISSASLGKKQLRDGDLVLEAAGGGPGKPVGHVGVFCSPDSQVYLTSNFFRTLRPNDTVLPRYLWWRLVYLIQEPRIWAYQQQTTGITNLKVAEYLSQQLDWPPLPEQRGITNVLDSTDDAILKTESLIAKLKDIKQGLLHDLLTRGLDENGELRDSYVHPERFADVSLGRIPKDWDTRPLETVSQIANGITLGRQVGEANSLEVPYLRVANLQEGRVDLSEIKTIRIFRGEMDRFLLQAGDVLLTEGGDFDKLGRGAVWDGQINPCAYQNHIFRVRTDSQVLLPKFLAAILMVSYGKRYFLRHAKQTTSIASINRTELGRFPVPCPGLKEQERIIAAFEEHESRIAEEMAYLMKLKSIKRGLMQDLLTGRVRVKAVPEMAKAEKER